MMNNKCRTEGCDKLVYGALHVPVYKKRTGIVVNDKYIPLEIEEYELWYYCKYHYKVVGALDKMIDKIIESVGRM